MINAIIIIMLLMTSAILFGWAIRQEQEIAKLERELKWLRKVVNDR